MSDTRELLNQRGWDLLRQMRMKLHEEDLITNEEYALLAVDHPAVKRLENYDVLRQQVESLRAERNEAWQAARDAGETVHVLPGPDTILSALICGIGDKACRLQEELAAEKQRADALEADAKLLRKMVWLRHGCPSHCLYGDDGKMDCNKCFIDFKNKPVEQIESKLFELAVLKWREEEAARKPVPQERLGLLNEIP